MLSDLIAIIFFPENFIFWAVEALRLCKTFSRDPSHALSKPFTCSLATLHLYCVSYSLNPPPTLRTAPATPYPSSGRVTHRHELALSLAQLSPSRFYKTSQIIKKSSKFCNVTLLFQISPHEWRVLSSSCADKLLSSLSSHLTLCGCWILTERTAVCSHSCGWWD